MTSTARFLLFAALAGSLGSAGYSYYLGQVRQAATLEKFPLLESRINTNNQRIARESSNTIKQLVKFVSRNRWQLRDKEVLQQAQLVCSRTQTLADTLRSLRQRLLAGGKPGAAGHRAAEIATPDVAELSQLAAHLDRHIVFIKEFVPNATPLTIPRNSAGKVVPFAPFYFEKMPLVAVLATLTQLEAQLRSYEAEAMQMQAQKFSSCCLYFDRIGALAMPESNTVAPGAIYRAHLFLSQTISDVQFLELRADGKVLTESGNGQGLVVFRIPPATPGQPDTLPRQWHGTVRAAAYPGDTTWHLDVPYFIVKQPTL